MPKLQIEANELTGTDVNFVSLVKRGANRLPFRIVKEDNEMGIDLSKIHRIFRKTDSAPAVVAAVVRKGADLKAVKTRLIKAGLSVAAMEEKDGVIVFKQPNVEGFDEGVLKLDDDIGLVVSGIAKAFDSFDTKSLTFSDLFATEGFYPSLHMAKDMLGYTVGNIMQKAETAGQAAEMISKAVDEFKAYVTALAASIPQHAFKADVERVSKSMTVNLHINAPSSNIEGSPTNGNETDQRLTTQGASNDIEGTATAGNETPRNPADKPNIGTAAASNDVEGGSVTLKADGTVEGKLVKGTVWKAPNGDEYVGDENGKPVKKAATSQPESADLAAQLAKAVADAIAPVQAAVTEGFAAVKKDVAAMDQRVEKVERRAQKAEEAAAGTVDADPGADKTGVRKSGAGKGPPPLLDTAFMKVDEAKDAA